MAFHLYQCPYMSKFNESRIMRHYAEAIDHINMSHMVWFLIFHDLPYNTYLNNQLGLGIENCTFCWYCVAWASECNTTSEM